MLDKVKCWNDCIHKTAVYGWIRNGRNWMRIEMRKVIVFWMLKLKQWLWNIRTTNNFSLVNTAWQYMYNKLWCVMSFVNKTIIKNETRYTTELEWHDGIVTVLLTSLVLLGFVVLGVVIYKHCVCYCKNWKALWRLW